MKVSSMVSNEIASKENLINLSNPGLSTSLRKFYNALQEELTLELPLKRLIDHKIEV